MSDLEHLRDRKLTTSEPTSLEGYFGSEAKVRSCYRVENSLKDDRQASRQKLFKNSAQSSTGSWV